MNMNASVARIDESVEFVPQSNEAEIAIDAKINSIYYGKFRAVRDSHVLSAKVR